MIGCAFVEANLAILLLYILFIRMGRRWGSVEVDQAPMLQEEKNLVKKCDVTHVRLSHLGECVSAKGLFFVLVARGWPWVQRVRGRVTIQRGMREEREPLKIIENLLIRFHKTVLERHPSQTVLQKPSSNDILLGWFCGNLPRMTTILRLFLQNRHRIVIFIYKNITVFLSKTIFHQPTLNQRCKKHFSSSV